MPKYIVTTPFGKQYSVVGPENFTGNDAVAYVQKQLGMYQPPAEEGAEEDDIYTRTGIPQGRSIEDIAAGIELDRSPMEALSAGLGRSFSRMGSTITDIIPSLAGSAIGADDYARQQLEEAAAKEAALQQRNPTQFQSFRDVENLGDVLPFLFETLGEQGANIASTIGTGGVGAIAGRTLAKRAAQKQLDELVAAQVARKTAEARAKALPTSVPIRQEAAEAAVARRAPSFLGAAASQGAETGAIAGTYAGGLGLSAPEIFQNIYENTGELAPAAAVLGGGFAAALDSILPLQVLKAFKSKPVSFQAEVIKKIGERKQLNSLVADLAGRTALGIGKGVATEAATEAAQEAVSIAAENFVREGDDIWGSKEFDRILESAVRGGIAGGAFGAVPGFSDALRTRAIEKEEFARREPPPESAPGAPVTGEDIDETLPPAIDAGPIAERSALTPVPVPPPVGGGLGSTDVPPILPGLNEEVAPEVRDVELTAEDFVELGRQGEEQSNLQETELEGAEDAATVADQDIQEEVAKAVAKGKPAPGEPVVVAPPETPIAPEIPVETEAPKLLTRDMLVSDFKFSPKSKVVEVLADKPYETPEQVAKLRSLTEENIKNPNQKKRVLSALSSLAPERELRPIPEGISAPELIPVIEQDKNAYTAIERVAGRNAAIAQLLGDKHVGKLPEKEALPYSGPTEQAQFEATLTDVEKASVRERLKGLRAADRRRERVVAEKEARVEAATPEAQEELTEVTGEGGAFETLTVPDIEKVTGRRAEYERLREDAESLVGNIPKGEDPMQYLTVAEKAIPDLKERAPVSRFKNFLKKPENEEFLDELQRGFAEAPAEEKIKATTPAKAREVIKGFLGREPENEDIRITTTPRAAGMKGVPQRAMAVAEVGGKKAALFTKRIPKGKEISVFMHEVGAHVGMERLVGKTNYKYLIDKVREWGSGKGRELEVSIAKAALARIPANTRSEIQGDEAIAYFVSEAVERGISPKAIAKVNTPLGTFFRYIMDGVKAILNRLGIPNYEPTTQDIVDIAYGAAQLTYKRADDAKAQTAAPTKDKKVEEAKPTGYMTATDEELSDARYTPPTMPMARRMLEWVDKKIESLPVAKPQLEFARDVLEGLSRFAKQAYLSLLSVTQIAEIVEKYSPVLSSALKSINNIAAARDVNVANRKQKIEKFILTARKVTAKYDPRVVRKLFDFMHESSIEQVKFDIDKRYAAAKAANDKALMKELEEDYDRVQNDPELKKLFDEFQEFEKKYPELAKLYYDLRNEYRQLSEEFMDALNKPELLGSAGKTLNELMKKRIDPYFPLYRRGDFWVRYVAPDGKEGVSAFETAAEARKFVRFLKQDGVQDKDIKEYIKPTEAQLESMMPLKEMQAVIKVLKEKLKSSSAPSDPMTKSRDEVMEGIYSIYLDMFSNQSVMQSFKRREGYAGYRNDALANFADVGTRMAINIEQFNSVRKLDETITKAKAAAKDLPQEWSEAVEATINRSEGFWKNPIQKTKMGRFASAAGHNAYRWFILGNVSSAIINITQLPIVVAPLLGGKFGWGATISAMNEASKMYFAGGQDTNSSFDVFGLNLSDKSFAGKKAKLDPEYEKLYYNAVQRGAVRRSTGQDLMEMRNLGVSDPENKLKYKMAKAEQALGWAFQNAERYNREVTLLAAYKLARKSGMSESKATDYALDLIEFAHGNAMSELGPQLFQTGPGKVFGVFKRFALNQIYLQCKLFKTVFAGADKETKKLAAKQFMGINAMAYAFAGAKGMPIFGGINLMASLLTGMFGDEDEPFDFDKWAEATFGAAGYRGPIGALLNLNLGTRTGFGDLLWRPDEKRLAEIGLSTYILEQGGGPALSIVNNIVKGSQQVIEGDTMKGLETMTPSMAKSVLRSVRFATEGVVNSKGYKIVDDPSAYGVFMSLVGFSPNDVNDAYSKIAIMKDFERKSQERRNGLLDDLWGARQAGDTDGIREINKEIYDFNRSKLGRSNPITPETKEKSYDMRKQREREAIFGASFNPKLLKAAMMEAGLGAP